MTDFLVLLVELLKSWEISGWVITVAFVLSICMGLLVREYGGSFISHILHRRNLPSLCGILVFLCVFLVLFQTGVFMKLHRSVQVLLSVLYGLHIVIVLRSVQGPVLLSKRYLKQYQMWLKRGQAHEHSGILEKKPWYLLDRNEVLSYQLLKGKYLYELGNKRLAYEVMSGVDSRLLYPEENAELTLDLVYMTLELGNFTKAEQLAEGLKDTAPVAYYFLKSYLSELQGDLSAAWTYACQGEDSISARNRNARILCALYTHLGRLSFFRSNMTEMFRYYNLALEQAKRYGDIRLLHPSYQNLIHQIQLQHLHEDRMDELLKEYMSAVSEASVQNMIELANFRVALARQQGDREKEYQEILAAYEMLHQNTVPPEQYVVEMSALRMLTNGDYDATAVLNDVAQHFDNYFSMPLPGRFVVLQGLTRPRRLTAKQAEWYEAWTPRLIEYANNCAEKDLDDYERTLPTDCVNERCWVIHQRIDFLRRGKAQYDGGQVLQWLQEIVQIQRDHNQVFGELETELTIIKQFEEMLSLGQLRPSAEILREMKAVLTAAYKKSKQLPAMSLGVLLIDFAYFGCRLEEGDVATDAWKRFCKLKMSPQHLSLEQREKLFVLEQAFHAAPNPGRG